MIVHINKKKTAVMGVSAAVILAAALAAAGMKRNEEAVYRETAVELGNLVVGVTEDGTVDIGTVEQIFELDMSALERADTGSGSGSTGSNTQNTSSGGTGSFPAGGGSAPGGMGSAGGTGGTGGQSSGTGGGLDMFSQLFGMADKETGSSEESAYSLKVKQVLVTVGQQVEEGDVLYLLEEDSMSRLEEELSANVEKAKADLDAVYADQKLSRNTAEFNYNSSIAYGSYASSEFESTVSKFQEEVNTCEQNLKKAQIVLTDYEDQLSRTTADYQEALELLEQSEWGRDNADKWNNTYEYTANFQLAQKAASNADTLKQKKEQLEEKKEQASRNVESLAKELSAARRNLETGKLTAQETLSLNQLAYSTAQETKDVAYEYLEIDAASQERTYEEAREKLEEFSSHIKENAVCAEYGGVITSVDLTEGDSINTGDVLAALYNMNEVTMKVTVAEEDMTDISEGTEANISFTAYPDTVFKASVTEISDAATDSNGSVVYEVTVTLKGDVSGLFQGMTGTMTFITKETKEVLYVSNRAVVREGGRSYVKVKESDGNIRKQEVKTGFSDGINVEIREGLSEGDKVLIESKVNES